MDSIEDPELLLAIALSQSLLGTSEISDSSICISENSECKEMDESTGQDNDMYFVHLLDVLPNFSGEDVENLKTLSKTLDYLIQEKDLQIESIHYISQLSNALWTAVYIAHEEKKIEKEKSVSTILELSKSTLQFCLFSLEVMLSDELDDKMKNGIKSVFQLLKLLLCHSSNISKNNLTQKIRDLKSTSIPLINLQLSDYNEGMEIVEISEVTGNPIDRLFSYTPKEIQTKITSKFDSTREKITQTNLDLFINEFKGFERLSNLLTRGLVSEGVSMIANSESIYEYIHYTKYLIDLLAYKKSFQESEVSQLFESSADLFLHLVYTNVAAYKSQFLTQNSILVDNKTLQEALQLIRVFGGQSLKVNFLQYAIIYTFQSLSDIASDDNNNNWGKMIFPPTVDFEIIYFLLDSYKKFFLTNYSLKPHSIPEILNSKYQFNDFNCLDHYNWEQLKVMLLKKINIVDHLFSFLIKAYQQIPYVIKNSKEQDLKNKNSNSFVISPITPISSSSIPTPPTPPQPPKPAKPSQISSIPPSPSRLSLFAMRKETPESIFKFKANHNHNNNNEIDAKKQLETPQNSNVASNNVNPSGNSSPKDKGSRSLISFMGYLLSFSNFIFTFKEDIFRFAVKESIKRSHLDSLLMIAKYQSPQVYLPQHQFGPLISESSFQQQFRFFVNSLITNNILSEDQTIYLLQRIGLERNNQNSVTWPLLVPFEYLVIAFRIISHQRNDHSLFFSIWEGFIFNLEEFFNQPNITTEEIVNSENVDFLLLVFYLLSDQERIAIFQKCVNLLLKHNPNFSQLALCRLIMIVDYVSKNFEDMPESLELRLKSTYFDNQKSVYIPCQLFSSLQLSSSSSSSSSLSSPSSSNDLSSAECTSSIQDQLSITLYQLDNYGESDRFQHYGITQKILFGDKFENLPKIVKLLNLQNKWGENTQYHSLISDYYFEICWRFIINLPEVEKYFSNIELHLLESNEQLLYLYFVARSTVDNSLFTQSQAIEALLITHVSNMISKLQSISPNFNQSVLNNPRILSLLQGITIIFDSALSIANEQSPLFQFIISSESLIQSMHGLINNTIHLLKELRKEQFSNDDIDRFDTIDILLTSAIPSSTLIHVFSKIISPQSLEYMKEWESDVQQVFGKTNASEKIFNGFIRISSISHESKNLAISIKSTKTVLYNLFHLFTKILQKRNEVLDYSSPLFGLFAVIYNDSSLQFLLKHLSVNLISGADGSSTPNATLVYTLKNFDRLFHHLANIKPPELLDTLEDIIVSLFQRMMDSQKNNSYERNIPILSIINLTLSTQNPKINSYALNLFLSILQNADQKSFIISFFEILDSDILSQWLKTKIVSKSHDVTQLTNRLVLLLSESSHSVGEKLLSVLYNLFEYVITTDISSSKPFFGLVKKLSARHNKYPDLILKFSQLIQSNDFQSKDPNDPTHLNSMELILNFLKNLLEQILDKQSPSNSCSSLSSLSSANDKMDIEDKAEVEADLSQLLCTYTVSEKSFIEQHWYYCYTCDLTFTEGVCSVCAKVCHKGHDLSYSRKSRFYCDCGGGKKSPPCKCLQPRAPNPPNSQSSNLSNSNQAEEKRIEEVDITLTLDDKIKIVEQIKHANLVPAIIDLYTKFIHILQTSKDKIHKSASSKPSQFEYYMNEKKILPKGDIFKLRKTFKGPLDIKLKADSPNSKEVKQYLSNKLASKTAISASPRGILAVAENTTVSIRYCSAITFKAISKHTTTFNVLHTSFNNSNPNFLAIAGLKNCAIITLNDKGEITDTLQVLLGLEFELDERASINQICWIPGSQVKFAVISTAFVKIYDLSKDSNTPIHYFTLLDDSIRASTFIRDELTGAVTFLTIADTGMIFIQELTDSFDSDACIMIETLQVDSKFGGKRGTYIYYSPVLDLVFASYEDGKTFAGKLDKSKSCFSHLFSIAKPEMGSFSRIVDIPEDFGCLVCLNRRSHCAVGIHIGKDLVQLQLLKVPNSRADSICTIPLKSGKHAILVLTEDGALHRFDYAKDLSDIKDDQPKEKESAFRRGLQSLFGIKKDDAVASSSSKKSEKIVPIDFFEKVDCITPSIKITGDALSLYSSEVVKQKLENSNDFLMSPNPDRFSVTIQNPNPDIVMIALRVLVGNSQDKAIPKSINIFDRVINCKEGMRRWYEIVFTTEECLRSDKEFTFVASPTFSHDCHPIIDQIEVYGQSKKEFGWQEKVDKLSGVPLEETTPPNQLESCAITTAEILSSYFSIISSEDRQLNANSNQILLSGIPQLLNQPSLKIVHESAKQLLSSLHDSKTEYYQLIDKIQLNFIVREISESFDDMKKDAKEELLHKCIQVSSKILSERESNFFAFLNDNPKFPSTLYQMFETVSKVNLNKSRITPALILDLLKIFLGYGRFLMNSSLNSMDLAALRPSFKLISDLLYFSNPYIQFTSSKLLSKIFADHRSSNENEFYQCDSCNNIIKSERWHCTNCAEYDLCFKCKNFKEFPKDGEHNVTHSLVAMSIDIEQTPHLKDMELQENEENEEYLLQMALEMSLNNSKLLDGPFRYYSFEQLFYIYLLAEFNTSKTNSIASLQLIYSLITDCDYENFVKDRVDLLLSTIKDSISVFSVSLEKRSIEIEAAILLLRLINYTIKAFSKKNSADFQSLKKYMSSQLVSFGFISLLLNCLLNLESEFKKFAKDSTRVDNTDSNGSLLIQSKDAPTESYFPFFRDSYVKKYGHDIFAEYKKVYPSSIINVAHYLIKSEGISSLEIEKTWSNVLCNIINSSRTSFLHSKAKLLLRIVCKDKVNYYKTRDFGQFANLEKKFLKLFHSSNSFKSELNYNQNVSLIQVLNNLWQTVSARPFNWKFYILQKEELVSALLNSSFYMKDEACNLVLKLMSYIFIPPSEHKKSSSQANLAREKLLIEKKIEQTNSSLLTRISRRDFSDKERLLKERYKLKEREKEREKERGEREREREREREKEKEREREREREREKERKEKEAQVDMEIDSDDSNIPVIPEVDYQETVKFFMNGDELSRFVSVFLLEINTSSMRTEARNLLTWMWNVTNNSQKEFIFSFLCQKITSLPTYGRNSNEFVELLMNCVEEITKSQNSVISSYLPSFFEQFISSLKSQNLLIINHPNSFIYQTISNLIDLDGYYLESEPCLVCNDPEIPFSLLKLESMKLETKYTSTTKVIQFTHSFIIQSISIIISNISNSRLVKTINLYYNNKPVQDLTELKNKWSSWKKLKTCNFAINQIDFTVDFPIPVTATNFMIEFESFYENMRAGTEKLMCPRCNRPVNDKHGICSKCNDNAYQCRQCRNINYEDLNAYLCNECGYCKNAEFNFTFYAKPSFASEKIETDTDRDRGMQVIDKESANAHAKYLQLMNYKITLSKLVNQISPSIEDLTTSSSNTGKINKKIVGIVNTYSKDCKTAFDSLSKSIQLLMATRKELVRYNSRLESKPDFIDAKVRPNNKCFGCANSFITICLSLFENLLPNPSVKRILIDNGLIQELITNNLLYGSESSRYDARRVICLLISDDENASRLLTDLISSKLSYCLQNYRTLDLSSCIKNEMQLLSEICKIEDSCWELRLKFLFQLFFFTIQFESNNPIISEQILLPCLKQIVEFTKNSKNSMLNFLPTTNYQSWTQNKTSFNQWKSHSTDQNDNNDNNNNNTTTDDDDDVSGDDEVKIYKKVLRVWKMKAENYSINSQNYAEKIENSWIIKLLFNRCSKSVRLEISDLILTLCSNEKRTIQFLEALTNSLPISIQVGDNSAEFFKLYFKLIEPAHRKIRLTMSGFLSKITNLILNEIQRIRTFEGNYTTDISQGYVLKTFIDILALFLNQQGIKRKFKTDQLMIPLLDGFLSLRGVIVQKTKYIDESSQQLSDLLKALHSSNEEDNQLFITACVKALEKHQSGRTPIFIFEQLCDIVCPIIPDPVYLMELTKSQSIEDFIRGSMNKNPYSSAEIGPLMRDVKNKICRDLELHGLIEDDNGMELLVCDKIIKLDLTIKQVFEHVWMKSEKYQKNNSAPMTVVYRLQGLEVATEEIVDNLTNESNVEEDPEIKYSVTSIMSKFNGLEIVLSQIDLIKDFELEKELATLIFKFLYHCLKIKVNRIKMLEMKSITLLLEKLKLVFPKESLADIAELLLLIIESIVSEANERDDSMDVDNDTNNNNNNVNNEKKMDDHEIEEGVSQMMMFLEKLSSPLVRFNQRIVKSVTRILPVLTYGEEKISKVLVSYFLPYLNFAEYDLQSEDNLLHNYHLECFTSVTNSIRGDVNGMKLKDLFLRMNVIDNLYHHLQSILPKDVHHHHHDQQNNNNSAISDEWKTCVSKKSIAYVLSSLSGLTKGFIPAQSKAIEYNILNGVFQLCSISTKNKIGNLAEQLIDSLTYNNATLNQAVDDCIQRSKETKSNEAKKYREKVLASMGITQEKNKLQLSLGASSNLMMMDIEDEKGLTCKVCKEGYSFMPNEILGFYVFSKRVSFSPSIQSSLSSSIVASPKSRRVADEGYSTVTNFNIIHFMCHKEAARADQELKPKKEEWEGAALRNSSTKCNNIFPLFAPSISEDVYSQYVDKYWNCLANICGRCESTRFRLLSHDLQLVLLRLATESSFHEDSKGGNRESNFIAVPFYMQMGLFLLDQTAGAQRRVYESALTQFLRLNECSQWISSSTIEVDNICFMLILSVFLHSLEEWQFCRKQFLERSLIHAFIENRQNLKNDDITEEKLFKECRSMLIYFGIIDKLQSTLKGKSSIPPSDDFSVSHKLDEDWIETLKHKLRFSDYQCVEDCKEILREFEEESLLVFENFDEFFEVIGVYASVLSVHPSSGDYVMALFNSFRNNIAK